MKCGSGLSSKIYLSYKFTCIVIRFRVKHDLHNKHMYKIMETTVDIESFRRGLHKCLVAIFPMTTNLKGRNPYIPAALESGVPVVLTVNAAEDMCEDCHDLITRNPMDPFNIVRRKFPFLVSNINEGKLIFHRFES